MAVGAAFVLTGIVVAEGRQSRRHRESPNRTPGDIDC
jgi:hypothetical protein